MMGRFPERGRAAGPMEGPPVRRRQFGDKSSVIKHLENIGDAAAGGGGGAV